MFLLIKKHGRLRWHILLPLLAAGFALCGFLLFSKAHSTAAAERSFLLRIYLDEKKLYLFENNRCVREYAIASGKPDTPSPIGCWKIVEKCDWGEGFGGRWLGLDVPWGIYGIHGTLEEGSIGQAASHGCVRMFNRDIRELYDAVAVGTPVIITNGQYGPFGTGFRELIPGDRGADVLAVQKRLGSLGYYFGPEDGIYEDALKQAVYRFQRENGLAVKYTITREDYLAMSFREID